MLTSAGFGLLRYFRAFGFRRGNYGHSMAIGERVLLPAVRKAAPQTLIVADGFSCREQIVQRDVLSSSAHASMKESHIFDGAGENPNLCISRCHAQDALTKQAHPS